jgi:hypothetical protein
LTAARCSVRSALLGEPMAGTASQIHRYLLIEAPGPWGVEALRDARLPADLKRELRHRSRSSRVRVLLIRRFRGPRTVQRPRVFVVDASPAQPMASGGMLTDLRGVLDLDVWNPTADPHRGLEHRGEPLFLVCTHGRHDPCCAERGRPLARALSAAYPEQVWECSHLGGDRFAGNLLCLPHGISYGRVAAEDGATIATEYLLGRLDLAHLRGRGSYPFAVQAAEWHLRTRLGSTGVDDLVLTRYHVDRTDVAAVFATATGASWSVQMRIAHAPPQRLTCHTTRMLAAPRFQLLQVDRLDTTPT